MKFRMPGEFEPHQGCIMIWPYRPGSWPYGAAAARKAFRHVAEAIAESEKVYMLAGPECFDNACASLSPLITVLPIKTDDAWARDVGPTFITDDKGWICGVNWLFNAWGGTYNGLYSHWERDNEAAAAICDALNFPCFPRNPFFVMEGGAVHSDGDGTLMVTASCLLSPGRNPELSRELIDMYLCGTLGGEKILWLPHGIYGDETDEHVDNVAAFVKPGEIVLAWTDDESDPQYAYSKADLDYLESQTDAKGRRLKIHKIPLPAKPVQVNDEDLGGYEFEPGEIAREAGEKLAASYINFYISNRSVIIPAFGDKNDSIAADMIGGLFPDRSVIQIYARDILLGGGGIHCITQQIPKGGFTDA